MPKVKPLQTRPAAPQKLEHWMVDVLRSGQPILSAPPPEHWRHWRDGGEGLAAWRHHRASLLRDEDPAGWWAVKAYDRGMTPDEIEAEQAAAYLSEMTAYQREQQALLDEMARKLGAARRRERSGAGEGIQ